MAYAFVAFALITLPLEYIRNNRRVNLGVPYF